MVSASSFIEVFVDCPLEVCERRDVKGLYKKARAGEIKNFTGISSVFEEPLSADIVLKTNELTIEHGVNMVKDLVQSRISLEE
jgi:adenylylsulfate kinase-like enzyme